MSLRVLLVGQEAAGAQILRAVSGSAHQVVAVLTQDPLKRGGSASLASIAGQADIPVFPARLVKDPAFAEEVRAWEVDVMLNVHSLHIVADAVLAAPRVGSFNLHPGPLPEYAGLNTVGWAIYNGETKYGVTVHWMHPGIDTGPIALEERFPVPPHATALQLAAECTRRGVPLLLELLDRAEQGADAVPSEPQDSSARVYYARDRIPRDGRVDWSRPGVELERFARAFDYGPFASPWGLPTTLLGERTVGVLGLRPTGRATDWPAGTHRVENGSLHFAASDQWIEVARVFVDGVPVRAETLSSLAVLPREGAA
jgi:UDP-4-amino-4-deoxy-L-arabinose formyltransferase/UDP-glucuronic acid dehydrogenase (UDP-4-keto-hexauronic acid decarboxylating)